MRLPFSGLDEDAPRLGVSTLCMVAHWEPAKRKGVKRGRNKNVASIVIVIVIVIIVH